MHFCVAISGQNGLLPWKPWALPQADLPTSFPSLLNLSQQIVCFSRQSVCDGIVQGLEEPVFASASGHDVH